MASEGCMNTGKICKYAEGFKTYISRAIPQSYRDDPLTLKTI